MMKRKVVIILFLIFAFCLPNSISQRAIFLHHSTGGNVYNQGEVKEWITNYNVINGTSISITERSFPNTPWPWSNYPFDYWDLWVNGSCNSEQKGIECLNTLVENYDLIILKHCFPGANILEDTGIPNINSSEKRLENYKLHYNALLEKFDLFQDTKFMIWTLAPLHRNSTNKESANRAFEFANWAKNEWLNEDGKLHDNIYIFDFFSLVAELAANPTYGEQYCLKYDYEREHDSFDSHPNELANKTVGPIFAQNIVEAILIDYATIDFKHHKSQPNDENTIFIAPSFILSGSPISFLNKKNNLATSLKVWDIHGKILFDFPEIYHNFSFSTNPLQKGIYIITMLNNQELFSNKLVIL